MDKKPKLKSLVSETGKKTKSLLNNAIQSIDQNNDSKFNFSDVSAIAGTVGNAVKKGTLAVKESAVVQARLLELKNLQPIFPTAVENAASLDDPDFSMPKFICIVDRDKRYVESDVCQGSVGYTKTQKGLRVVNIFRDSIDAFGLTFHPDRGSTFYYVDPSDCTNYIALDEYFSYLKISRINELKNIAENLGAKHFVVTYKEEQTTFSAKNAKTKSKAASIAPASAAVSTDTEHFYEDKKYSQVHIESDMTLSGHPPVEPQLKYLQKDPSIQALITMRMKESSTLLSEKYVLKMSQSSDMKEADAVKIDAILKGMKYSGNATVASEAQNESRRYLEYDIEF